MKLTILQVLEGSKREKLQELVFGVDSEHKDPGLEQSVKLVNGETIVVNAVHTLISMNLTLLVLYNEQHAATVMCHWGKVAPYFAIRLPNGAFVEFYFEK
jgi:hypothetical protein